MDACNRDRVNGLVKAEGQKLVNGKGEEILLRGVGLGNWLLPEGYMWQFGRKKNSARADRPRRIEALFTELAGKDYTDGFWKTFRDEYITEEDIKAISDAGFNSVRVPMNYRVFMEDGESTAFIESGFKLLDRLLMWCGKHSVYVILDLHGAPGGQTGANIDDCVDDIPRLFTDPHQYKKGIMLWAEIAKRYESYDIIAAYDILNEPLAPDHFHLAEKLMDFYTDSVRAIREWDKRHLLSIEGAKWATDISVFERFYDDNMVIHFHRYWCPPTEEVYGEFLELSKKLNAPLWLGESGENTIEWYGDMFPLSIKLNISWNFWPWKRMLTDKPTTCEIKTPEDWELILEYLDGGAHPGYEKCRKILDKYLENIKFKNTVYREDVVKAMLGIK